MSDLRTPTGRFANFLKASEHWGSDLLLGRFVAGLPDTVIALGDMRDTYAKLEQLVKEREALNVADHLAAEAAEDENDRLREQLAAATARAEAAEAKAAYWRGRAEFAWNDGDRAANDLVVAVFGDDADREEFRQKWARIAALGDPEIQHRLIGVSGEARTPTERDLALKAEWLPGVRHEVRDVYPGPWRDADDTAVTDTAKAYTADANQPEVRDPAAWCWSRHPDHPLPCGRLAGHEPPHTRGGQRWTNADDTEATDTMETEG